MAGCRLPMVITGLCTLRQVDDTLGVGALISVVVVVVVEELVEVNCIVRVLGRLVEVLGGWW